MPPEHAGEWSAGEAGETTINRNAEETTGLPGHWHFAFGFAGATVGTFTSGPAQGAGQTPGLFLMKQ